MNKTNLKKGIDKVFDSKGGLVAHIYDTNCMEGSNFPTADEDLFQFGFSHNIEKKDLRPHIHKNIDRKISKTTEFIYVIDGRIDMDILSEDAEVICSISLTNGCAILQFRGGHDIVLFEDTKYFEIKQGPYFGPDSDKTMI